MVCALLFLEKKQKYRVSSKHCIDCNFLSLLFATHNLLRTNMLLSNSYNLFSLAKSLTKCGNVQILSMAVTNEIQIHEEIEQTIVKEYLLLPSCNLKMHELK